jgi:rhodanese-related sulfurtransferase
MPISSILPLGNDLVVYPAHGAGSACGKNMSKETTDTLGNQKATNYALRPNLSKEEFIKELLTGLTPPPFYFPKNVVMNITGYDSIDDVLQRGTTALTVSVFEVVASGTNAVIIDTRKAAIFAQGFIPNSIIIGIDGSFAVWVGTLITDMKQPILIVADEGREQEIITRLARVGYDSAIGFLNGGFNAWKNAGKDVETINNISAETFAKEEQKNPNINILDVRKKSEYDSEHIVNALNAPLDYINDKMILIDKNITYYVHCAAGYRSMIFASILKARGYNNLINVDGGFDAIKKSEKFMVTDYVCPTTLL